MAEPRTTVADALHVASSHMSEAATASKEEALWIERNSLGGDYAYLRASVASRRNEIDRAHAEAVRKLDAAASALGMTLR